MSPAMASKKTKRKPKGALSMTFRQLVDRVAAEGKPANEHRTVVEMCGAAGVSRPHFYRAMWGNQRLTIFTIRKIAAAFAKWAPWVDEAVVRSAVAKSRAQHAMEELTS
jgi:hypothetical protein